MKRILTALACAFAFAMACNAQMTAAQKLAFGGGWKNPYVTDGLFMMWDAEWNVGGGKHAASTDVWVDLSGNGYGFDTSGFSFGENSLRLQNSPISIDVAQRNWTEATIEIVAKATNLGTGAILWAKNPSWVGGVLMSWSVNKKFYYPWGVILEAKSYSFFNLNNIQLTYKEGEQKLYFNGVLVATTSGPIDSRNILSTWTLGKYNTDVSPDITICSVRVYTKAMTESNCLKNYAVDKARFNLP